MPVIYCRHFLYVKGADRSGIITWKYFIISPSDCVNCPFTYERTHLIFVLKKIMELILKIMGGAVGLLVPYLFVSVLNKGLKNSSFDKVISSALKKKLGLIVWLWVGLVWLLSITNVLSYHEGDIFPRFVIPLFVPVIIGLFLIRNNYFKLIVNNIPLHTLVGIQTFRLAGFAFLLFVNINLLPKPFVAAGYGDIITGSLAILAGITLKRAARSSKVLFWAFMVAGIFDLLNVAFMMFTYYPIWNTAQPSSSAATEFSLVMVPAIAAPIALLLHLYSLRNFFLERDFSNKAANTYIFAADDKTN